MFISIPKEFFVPVIFSDGFVLNKENDNLELDTNLYREESKIEITKNINSDKKSEDDILNNFNESRYLDLFNDENDNFDESYYRESTAKIINKSINKNLENSKYDYEKENIVVEVEMNDKNCINKNNEVSNKEKDNDMYKECQYSKEIFDEIDSEIIKNIEIEGCKKNK